MKLEDFLATKELFYKDIDYDFFPSVWEKVSSKFTIPKIIHIIGTNGKGSTGRFLSYYLYKAGFDTGHYSSPHINKFNERIWLNGHDASDEILEDAHKRLLPKLDSDILEKLSYFEYTTLLAMEVFCKCNYVVLEAGLGGEYDATNVFEKLFTLVTPIGVDHQSFLGDSIEEIAKTKLRSITTYAIMTWQKEEVFRVADTLDIKYFLAKDFFTKEELQDIKDFIIQNDFATYLTQNLTLALSAVKKLNLEYDINFLKGIELKGRFQKISKNITVDVGHNKQAALAIKQELKDKKIVLIYNTYKDKDFKEILTILKPNIKKVLIIDIEGERVVDHDRLETVLDELDIYHDKFDIKNLGDENYLVFGSFLVVEKFLKLYNS